MSQSSETPFICHRLWNMLSVRQQGYWGHCSSSFSHQNKGYLFHSNSQERIHLSLDKELSQQNNSTLNEMRKKMLAGEIPPECHKCKSLEQQNFPSLRGFTNAEFGVDSDKYRKSTNADGSINLEENPLELLELRLTNHCNLGCRSCSPESSDKLVPIHQKVWGSATYKDLDEEISFIQRSTNQWTYEKREFDWVQDEGNWEKLKSYTPGLKKIHLTGGEPLLAPQHIDFLSYIVDEGLAGRITLEYNSNLSALPSRLVNLWKEFKKVQIGISIDGSPKVNEYIRRGTNTEIFEKNLRILDELNLQNFSIWFPFTLMSYNIFDLPNTYKYITSLNLKNLNKHPGHNLLRVHILSNPSFLNIDYLPQRIKKEVSASFSQFIRVIDKNSELVEYKEEITNQLSKIIDRLESRQVSEEEQKKNWEKFGKYTTSVDQIDGTSLIEIEPRFINQIP